MATAAYNLCLDYLRWLCRVPMFVGEWIPNARLTSCSWVNGVIYLLGDVVEDSIHHTCRWAYLGAKVLLMCFFPKIMAFADITTLCQGILGVLLQSCLCSILPLFHLQLLSPELLLAVLCICELEVPLRSCLSNGNTWCCHSCLVLCSGYFATTTLLRWMLYHNCYLSGCFVIDAASVFPLCRERDGPSTCGCMLCHFYYTGCLERDGLSQALFLSLLFSCCSESV